MRDVNEGSWVNGVVRVPQLSQWEKDVIWLGTVSANRDGGQEKIFGDDV